MHKVPSPCIQICTLDAAGATCLGCGRSVEEIADWMFMSGPERDIVMARLDKSHAASLPTLSAGTDES